jgi:aspartyl-tRNA(Asn)/glutamyl-tRNA(Gln) amidotransferase subunit A
VTSADIQTEVGGNGAAPEVGRIEGSVAEASFAAALDLLHATPVHPVDRRLPLVFPTGGNGGVAPAGTASTVPSSPPGPTNGGGGPSVAPAPGPSVSEPGPTPDADGPLLQALADQVTGRTSSVDLVTAALAAIESLDGPLRGMVAVNADGALLAAVDADTARAAGRPLGPLHGIPVTVKDVIHVAGLPTRAGSAAYEAHPSADAEGVARLRRAGAVIMGKASTHEFALGVTSPQSRNPHDPTRIPGGSSGGSAISVACGMALASLGTDTRASIRVPSALSGVVGFKATLGSIPTDGIVSLSWTMDHVAPMAATVADAALVLDVLMGTGRGLASVPADPTLRIGVAEAAWCDAERGVALAVTATLDALAVRGARLSVATRPSEADLALANAAGLVVSRCEAATVHRGMGLDRSLYWEEVADQLDMADGLSAVDYLDAQRLRAQLAEELATAFADVDVLAMPTVPIVAPPADDFARHLMLLARNAIPWSFVGFPAISVPCGQVDGLPVGIQLVAPPHREDLLVAAGRAVEEVVRA